MSEVIYIYTLTSPHTGKVFYVGQSKNPEERVQKHKSKMRKANGYFNHSDRRHPLLSVVETTTSAEAMARETWWIQFYAAQGCDLLNRRQGAKKWKFITGKTVLVDDVKEAVLSDRELLKECSSRADIMPDTFKKMVEWDHPMVINTKVLECMGFYLNRHPNSLITKKKQAA